MNAFAIPLLLLAVADDPVKPKLPLGKDTTVVSGPLDKNGYIDYEAALNERMGKGIKPEQNANVLLWQAFGPRPENVTMPRAFFDALGAPEPPAKGDYFVPFLTFARDTLNRDEETAQVAFASVARTLNGPWHERDFPDVAAWLKTNEKPLAVVAEAVKRPAYFNPLASDRAPDGMSNVMECKLPQVQFSRLIGLALASRATLRLGAGKHAEAWDDLIACHRLSRHLARGATLIESLVGYAIQMSFATPATLSYLEHADLTANQLLDRLAELQKLSPFAPLAEKLDSSDRFMILDAMQRFHAGKVPEPKIGAVELLVFQSLQWDLTLKQVNTVFDRSAMALRLKTRSERVKAIEPIYADLMKMGGEKLDTKEFEEEKKKDGVMRASSNKLGRIMVGKMMPAFAKVQDASDRAEQYERNLHVAVALAAYRKANGRYPAKLADLAPKFLAAVPDDLFAEKPLIYKPDANGYLLYSVGLNGKDDGGASDDLAVRVPLPKP